MLGFDSQFFDRRRVDSQRNTVNVHALQKFGSLNRDWKLVKREPVIFPRLAMPLG